MVLTDFSHPRDSPGSSAVILGPGSGSMPIRATLEHTLKFKEAGTLVHCPESSRRYFGRLFADSFVALP